MNEFRIKYTKLGVDYFIDFLTEENKTLLVLDKDQTTIIDVFQVKPENKYKFFDWIQKSKITWNFTASWSGNPSDIVVTEDVYKFGVLESTNSTLWTNTNINTSIQIPSTTYTDFEGNIITVPSVSISQKDITSTKTFAEMYAEATLQGVFFGETYLPELYVGRGTAGGDLFVVTP